MSGICLLLGLSGRHRRGRHLLLLGRVVRRHLGGVMVGGEKGGVTDVAAG